MSDKEKPRWDHDVLVAIRCALDDCTGDTEPETFLDLLAGHGYTVVPVEVAALPDDAKAVSHEQQKPQASSKPVSVPSIFGPTPTGDPMEYVDWSRFFGSGRWPRGLHGVGPMTSAEVDLTDPYHVAQLVLDIASSPIGALARRIQDLHQDAPDRELLGRMLIDKIQAFWAVTPPLVRIANALEDIARNSQRSFELEADKPGGIFGG